MLISLLIHLQLFNEKLFFSLHSLHTPCYLLGLSLSGTPVNLSGSLPKTSRAWRKCLSCEEVINRGKTPIPAPGMEANQACIMAHGLLSKRCTAPGWSLINGSGPLLPYKLMDINFSGICTNMLRRTSALKRPEAISQGYGWFYPVLSHKSYVWKISVIFIGFIQQEICIYHHEVCEQTFSNELCMWL